MFLIKDFAFSRLLDTAGKGGRRETAAQSVDG